jgi:acyl carrier protein
MRTTKDKKGKGAHRPVADPALRAALQHVLGLDAARVAAFDETTLLFGALPELDSMAVATLLTDLEDRFGIIIDDDDIDAETFESFGTLSAFLARKLAALND